MSAEGFDERLVDSFIIERSSSPDSFRVKANTELALTWNRFDVAFKLILVELYLGEVKSDYALNCYKAHIDAFSLGLFKEPGNESKNSFERFVTDFDALYRDLSCQGFDDAVSLIPLAKDGSILNGAHRTGASIYLGVKPTVLMTDIEPSRYDFSFFEKRGLSSDMLDLAARTFVKYSKNTYIAILWPSSRAKNISAVERELDKIVYKKTISLSYNGAHNLLSQVYEGEPWLGDKEKNYPGIAAKLSGCFSAGGDVTVIAFQADCLNDVLAAKDRVRALCGVGKHSIHITDTSRESIALSNLLFLDNSIKFLNKASPRRHSMSIQFLESAKKKLTRHYGDTQMLIVDDSVINLVCGKRGTAETKYDVSDCLLNYGMNRCLPLARDEELISNPKYYFYFDGVFFKMVDFLESDTWASPLLGKLKLIRARLSFLRIKIVFRGKAALIIMLKAGKIYPILLKVRAWLRKVREK